MSEKLPSSISNLNASTSACCMYSEKEVSYVSQIIFKTWCCFFVKFTFSLIVITSSMESLFLFWVSVNFEDEDGIGSEGPNGKLFIFAITNYFIYRLILFSFWCITNNFNYLWTWSRLERIRRWNRWLQWGLIKA